MAVEMASLGSLGFINDNNPVVVMPTIFNAKVHIIVVVKTDDTLRNFRNLDMKINNSCTVLGKIE